MDHLATLYARATAIAEPVFLSEIAEHAIKGKEPLEQLATLQKLVDDASFAKEQGSGPPVDEINVLRRRYIRIAEDAYRGIYTR